MDGQRLANISGLSAISHAQQPPHLYSFKHDDDELHNGGLEAPTGLGGDNQHEIAGGAEERLDTGTGQGEQSNQSSEGPNNPFKMA